MAAITTQGALSGNNLVNGLLWDGWKWDSGGSATLTYFFDNDLNGTPTKNWNDVEKAAFRTALQSYANVASLTFTEAGSWEEGNLVEFLFSDSQMTAEAGDNVIGFHLTPEDPFEGPSLEHLIGAYNYEVPQNPPDNPSWTAEQLGAGSFYLYAMIHELGHGLGLKHPFNTIGEAPLFPGVSKNSVFDRGDHDLNFRLYTVMAYSGGYGFDADGRIVFHNNSQLIIDGKAELTFGHPVGPMALDIAAIQYLYGANMSYRTGDDVYLLPDANLPGIAIWSCIWDAGGVDEMRYDGARNVIIDLTAAALDNSDTAAGVLSYAAFVYGGFTIANGVTIENASGGSGNDKISGNGADNILSGGDGIDTLRGRGGSDGFVFDAAVNPLANLDHIADFEPKADFIVLDADIFTKLKIVDGHLKKGSFHAGGGMKKAQDDNDRIIYNKKSGALFYDEDGKGGADATRFAILDGDPNDVSHKDFLVLV